MAFLNGYLIGAMAVGFVASTVARGQSLLFEGFDNDAAGPAAFLATYSPPWFIDRNPAGNDVSVVNGQLQIKEIVGENTVTTVAVPGYDPGAFPELVVEADVSASSNFGWYEVGMDLGGIRINFAPGYAAPGGQGWFKINNTWGGGDVGGTNMGFVPANMTMHRMKVRWKQNTGEFDITITDGSNPANVFDFFWSDPSAASAAGLPIALYRGGPDDHRAEDGLGMYDNVSISDTEIPPPADCSRQIFADADEDGDVDQVDFGVFQRCLSGDGGWIPADPIDCVCFDRDADDDVDEQDTAEFMACMTGPHVPIDPQNPPPGCILADTWTCNKTDFTTQVDDGAYLLANANLCYYKLYDNWFYPVNWIGSFYILNDLVDIYEYMEVNQLDHLTEVDPSCGDTIYQKATVYNDLLQRSRAVLDAALVGDIDDIRERWMPGFCQPLDANFGPLQGINYCWHFHTANALEPVARFISIARARTPEGVQEPAFLQDYFNDIRAILEAYYSEWLGRTYECPAETAYRAATVGATNPYAMNYNMAASISMAYLYLYDFSGDTLFLERTINMGEFMRDAVHPGPNGYCVWKYDAVGVRPEDPDHALEDLRLAIALHNRGLVFSEDHLHKVLTTWFDVGLDSDGCLTCYIEGECSIHNSSATLEGACARSLFVLRFMQHWFDGCLDQAPFPCVPTGCDGC